MTFTRRGIAAGFALGATLAPGVLVYGMVFGVLASEAHLSALETVLMSGLVYSGSAQLAVLQGWSKEVAMLPAVATILIMNARYLLYGAALRPWLGSLPPGQTLPSLFFLGDGNWALSLNRHALGERDAGIVLGSGVSTYLPWLGGSLAGYLAGSAVADPTALGFDFMLVAFSAAMAVSMWRGRGDMLPAVAAVVVALVFDRFAPGGWTIVAAGLAGAAVAYHTHRTRA